MSEPMYTIKPLEWREFEPGNWRALSPTGTYELVREGAGHYWVRLVAGTGHGCLAADIVAGKLAATAHYTARMREGLSPVKPDIFWDPESDEPYGHDDPETILQDHGYDEGTVFRVGCGLRMPDEYYVALADDEYRPVTPEEVEAYLKAEADSARKPPHIGHAGESFPIVPSMMKPASDAGRKGGG